MNLDDLKLAAQLFMAKKKEGANDGFDHTITSAGKKGLRCGKISELTCLAPLKPGGAEQLKKILEIAKGDLSGGATKVGTLHDMRIVFLDNDTKILFCTAYDGDWDTYIDDFATKIPELMDIIFGNVEGWPGITSPTVKQFIIDCQITAAGWYVAFPQLTVADTRKENKIVTGLNSAIDDANK